MYAVIETGGKQYRVQPGDLIVVDKLGGDVGATIAFERVLMLGDGAAVTVGVPTVAGAKVEAALIETRKGDKIKVFKKIRRQGYRRTGGHRQWESVLRVTAVTGAGSSAKWDGKVDLTPRSVLNARARGLAVVAAEPVAAPAKTAKPKPAPKAAPAPVAEAKSAPAKAAPKSTPKADAKGKAAPKAGATAKAAPAAKADAAPKAEAKAKAAPKAKAAAKPAKAAAPKKPAKPKA
jgi:large subunit ribosomal protein L21